MQAQEAMQKVLATIAAKASGQVPNVRTFMGRQVHLTQDNTFMTMLPQVASTDIQNQDPTSPDYGKFYYMVNLDVVDGGNKIR